MESLDDLHYLRHAFDSGNYVHLYPLGNPVSLFMCHVLAIEGIHARNIDGTKCGIVPLNYQKW